MARRLPRLGGSLLSIVLTAAVACGSSGSQSGTGGGESGETGSGGQACHTKATEDDCTAATEDCRWTWAYPSQLGEGGCAFGEPVGVCYESVDYGDGCGPDPWGCDMGQPSILWREGDDGIIQLMEYVAGCSHAVTDGFQTCAFGDEENTTGDPGSVDPTLCACACEPDWPG